MTEGSSKLNLSQYSNICNKIRDERLIFYEHFVRFTTLFTSYKMPQLTYKHSSPDSDSIETGWIAEKCQVIIHKNLQFDR